MVPWESGATSTPMMKKMRPHAASEKATGYPSSRNTTSDANMIGAMFCAMNSAISDAPADRIDEWAVACSAGCRRLRAGALLRLFLGRLDHALGLGFRRCMVAAAADRVLQVAPDDRDALDEL